MSLDYLSDRIPVIPMSVHTDEKILAVHIEGEPAKDVDLTVESNHPGEKPGTSRICCRTSDDKTETLILRNDSDWVSVLFHRVGEEAA